MVYCGKPSRGCQMCRTRRIKCDETKPTCLQCQKSRRQCPGYKDDFDLVFRNETQATERRARRAVNSKRVSAQVTLAGQQSTFSTVSGGIEASYESEGLISPLSDQGDFAEPTPSSTLSIPIDQQAPCYFISNYVLIPRSGSRGYFDFLVPMLRNESPDSHLSLAFSAVSLASLGNRPSTRGRAVFPQAIAQYAKALKALNIALQKPAQQKTDQTLAAILMLGFFETIASEKSSASAWYSHIDGAVQLVKMRGKKQLRTKVGYSLFMCVRTQMTVSCISGSKAPSLGTEWWIADATRDEAASFATSLNLRIAELRSEINHALGTYSRTPECYQEVINLMKRAQALEQEYLAWEEQLPNELRPHTVAWVDQIPGGDLTKADVFPGKVDMYEDIWTSSLWNSSRIARLFISGAIVRCAAWICSPVDYRTTPEYATAVRLCVDLITDVIASIPYNLGWRVGPGGALRASDHSGSGSEADASSFPKSIGGFFAIWPLFSISNTDYTSDSQRQWAKGRLVFISEILGLNHAKVLSNFQLRLPSMIIRRDSMLHGPISPSSLVAGRTSYPSPPTSTYPQPSPNLNEHITTTTINKLAAQEAASSSGMESSAPPSAPLQTYPLTPLQQREAIQKETWEKERKLLLKKASNGQGDSVERLLANYLSV